MVTLKVRFENGWVIYNGEKHPVYTYAWVKHPVNGEAYALFDDDGVLMECVPVE